MRSRKVSKQTKKLTSNRRRSFEQDVVTRKRLSSLDELTALDQELKLYGEDLTND